MNYLFRILHEKALISDKNELLLTYSAVGGCGMCFIGSKVVLFLIPFLLVQCLLCEVHVLFVIMRNGGSYR